MAENGKDPADIAPEADSSAPTKLMPVAVRAGFEIPKPLDWQQFQRASVVLFRAELGDPSAQEYGRLGQDQGGIDILGRRDNSPDQWVGVQCRRVDKPLSYKKILEDCRKSLKLKAALKEIIFVTTAPDDTKATDAAIDVEKLLRGEGHDIKIAVFGWRNLCTLIATHDAAYIAFNPSVAGTTSARNERQENDAAQSISDKIDSLAALIKSNLGPIAPRDDVGSGDAVRAGEDAALHARIDTFRDLFKQDHQSKIAERALLNLLSTVDKDKQSGAFFRIKTNLAAIAMEGGRDAEGALLYEEAYAARPNEAMAVANLGLARLIQGKPDEAIKLCEQALAIGADTSYAIGYILQAAARSPSWSGTPESLIPEKFAGDENSDIGLAEFYRVRSISGWQQKAIELAGRHPDSYPFKRLKAMAVLTLATEGSAYLAGGVTAISPEELSAAADVLKLEAERTFELATADSDVEPIASNASLALRMCNRFGEAENLLQQAIKLMPSAGQLRKMLGLMQALQGRIPEALQTLSTPGIDADAGMLAAELEGSTDPAKGLARALSLRNEDLTAQGRIFRWHLTAELALKVGDDTALDEALERLEAESPNNAYTAILRLDRKLKKGVSAESLMPELREIAANLPAETDLPSRVLVAQEMRRFGDPADASRILEGHIDLSRPTPSTMLYLQSLAAARRDETLNVAMSSASESVRSHPGVLWLSAAHAWNIGDLPTALSAISRLLTVEPRNFEAALLKCEILTRLNRLGELTAELEQPIETYSGAPTHSLFRLASILAHFGFEERAAALAYQLFLAHQDEARAWMTLSGLVLQEGVGDRAQKWSATEAGLNTAINVEFTDGQKQFFIIEPNPELRKLDGDSWEPGHVLSVAVLGHAAEYEFKLSDGREGKIVQVRHKYVARLHFIMEHYEARFPTIFGFRKINFDTTSPDGLAKVREELKERADWIEEETRQYISQNMPVALYARRIGTDPIDAALSIVASGAKVKVANGTEAEREQLANTLLRDDKNGCVLDLATYWAAWQLSILDVITGVCGLISVAQTTMDVLRQRRERIAESEADGLRSMSWNGSQIVLTETTPDQVIKWRLDIDAAIDWLEKNARIEPVIATDALPEPLVDHLRQGRSALFNEIILALQKDYTLLCDDITMRQVGDGLGVKHGAWLHGVLQFADAKGLMDGERYCRASALLIDAGQDYISLNGNALVNALRIDLVLKQSQPGPVYRSLVKAIGGVKADPRSHLVTVLGCLKVLWEDDEFSNLRKPATGLLIESLLHERTKDHRPILRALVRACLTLEELADYLIGWAKGHFLYGDLVDEPKGQRPRPKNPRRKS